MWNVVGTTCVVFCSKGSHKENQKTITAWVKLGVCGQMQNSREVTFVGVSLFSWDRFSWKCPYAESHKGGTLKIHPFQAKRKEHLKKEEVVVEKGTPLQIKTRKHV